MANSNKTFITESKITFQEAFYMPERFVFLNMLNQGVWYVDIKRSQWEKIKEAAMKIARRFGDKKTIEKLENL